MAIRGYGAFPGFSAEYNDSTTDIFWGGDMGRLDILMMPMVLDGTIRDATNSPTTVLRPGLLLARNSSNKLVAYDPTGTGGVQKAIAVLPVEIKVTDFFGVNQDRTLAVVVRGPVRASKLIGLDYASRGQLADAGFRFDDNIQNDTYQYAQVTDLGDAAYTVSANESGVLFVIRPTASRIVTLPACNPGLTYEFVNHGSATFVLTSAEGDNMIVGNDLEADSVSFATAGEIIGVTMRVTSIQFGSTKKWLVQQLTCPPTAKTGTTATIVT